jgi:hypothetical protein
MMAIRAACPRSSGLRFRRDPFFAENEIVFAGNIPGQSSGRITRELAEIDLISDTVEVDSHVIDALSERLGDLDHLGEILGLFDVSGILGASVPEVERMEIAVKVLVVRFAETVKNDQDQFNPAGEAVKLVIAGNSPPIIEKRLDENSRTDILVSPFDPVKLVSTKIRPEPRLQQRDGPRPVNFRGRALDDIEAASMTGFDDLPGGETIKGNVFGFVPRP